MILVTGGSGCLGLALGRSLAEQGGSVRLFDLKPPATLPPGSEFAAGDVRDPEACRRAAAGCETIFHFVGLMPQQRVPELILRAVNVGGTANVLRAAVEGGVRRFVFVSSMEVYGPPTHIPIRESDPKHPIGTYGKLKLEGEELCTEAMRRHGIEVVILRPSTLVGAGLTDRQLLSLMSWVKRKIPLLAFDGGSRFQMTGLSDCVSACILAAERPEAAGGVFNIGADDPPTVVGFIREVKRRTRNPFPVIPVPAAPLRHALAWLDRMGISRIPPDHYRMIGLTLVMDCSRAKAALGWQPKQSNIEMFMEAYLDFVSRSGRAS